MVEGQTYLPTLVSGGRPCTSKYQRTPLAETYATFFLVSMVPIARTTGYFLWEATIQFNIHHNLAGTALYVATQFMDALNSIRSTAHLKSSCRAPRQSSSAQSLGIELGDGLGQNGRDCWIAHFTISLPWTY